jgi:hypothetical protein
VPPESLAAAIARVGDPVALLRNAATPAHTFPIAPEFTNWRSEQRVSLATVDVAHSTPGTEVVVLWGEEAGSAKPQVEHHRQWEIRATVAPAPYVQFARDQYRGK